MAAIPPSPGGGSFSFAVGGGFHSGGCRGSAGDVRGAGLPPRMQPQPQQRPLGTRRRAAPPPLQASPVNAATASGSPSQPARRTAATSSRGAATVVRSGSASATGFAGARGFSCSSVGGFSGVPGGAPALGTVAATVAAAAAAAGAGQAPASTAGGPTASAASGSGEHQIMGRPALWQRADVRGRVRQPRLESDRAKLIELSRHCREGSFREVLAIVTHFPYLLSLTDKHGFTPLHHAEMSGKPELVAELLKLYRNPRTYTLKLVRYDSAEEMLQDRRAGCLVFRKSDDSNDMVVDFVDPECRARSAGVMAGDVLEAVCHHALVGHRQPAPSNVDVFGALCNIGTRSSATAAPAGAVGLYSFPLTLEFRGAAAREILGSDGWTPGHGAAALSVGDKYRSILDQLMQEQEDAALAQDAQGCTAAHWSEIGSRAVAARRRRPLSAGHGSATAMARGLQEGTLRPQSGRSRPASASAARSTCRPASGRPSSAGLRPSRLGAGRPLSARPATMSHQVSPGGVPGLPRDLLDADFVYDDVDDDEDGDGAGGDFEAEEDLAPPAPALDGVSEDFGPRQARPLPPRCPGGLGGSSPNIASGAPGGCGGATKSPASAARLA